jgi:hypothetical protein
MPTTMQLAAGAAATAQDGRALHVACMAGHTVLAELLVRPGQGRAGQGRAERVRAGL